MSGGGWGEQGMGRISRSDTFLAGAGGTGESTAAVSGAGGGFTRVYVCESVSVRGMTGGGE